MQRPMPLGESSDQHSNVQDVVTYLQAICAKTSKLVRVHSKEPKPCGWVLTMDPNFQRDIQVGQPEKKMTLPRHCGDLCIPCDERCHLPSHRREMWCGSTGRHSAKKT